MTPRPLVLLALCALATLPSGCWWLQPRAPEPERPVVTPLPATRLAAWGVHRLGFVSFGDATGSGAGPRVTAAFRAALAAAQGAPVPLVGPPALGLVGIGQAQAIGRALGADALVTGVVLAYGAQPLPGPLPGPAWVSVSLRLLATGRGSIIWSRNVTGIYQDSRLRPPAVKPKLAAVPPGPNTPLDLATDLAAKEFIDDLLASPLPPSAGAEPFLRLGELHRPAR